MNAEESAKLKPGDRVRVTDRDYDLVEDPCVGTVIAQTYDQDYDQILLGWDVEVVTRGGPKELFFFNSEILQKVGEARPQGTKDRASIVMKYVVKADDSGLRDDEVADDQTFWAEGGLVYMQGTDPDDGNEVLLAFSIAEARAIHSVLFEVIAEAEEQEYEQGK